MTMMILLSCENLHCPDFYFNSRGCLFACSGRQQNPETESSPELSFDELQEAILRFFFLFGPRKASDNVEIRDSHLAASRERPRPAIQPGGGLIPSPAASDNLGEVFLAVEPLKPGKRSWDASIQLLS